MPGTGATKHQEPTPCPQQSPTTAWEDFEAPGPRPRRTAHPQPPRPPRGLRPQAPRCLPAHFLRPLRHLRAGVDRRLEDAEDTRVRLQWGPFAKDYRENDTSAFKKRKAVRPDGSIDWIVLRPVQRSAARATPRAAGRRHALLLLFLVSIQGLPDRARMYASGAL